MLVLVIKMTKILFYFIKQYNMSMLVWVLLEMARNLDWFVNWFVKYQSNTIGSHKMLSQNLTQKTVRRNPDNPLGYNTRGRVFKI